MYINKVIPVSVVVTVYNEEKDIHYLIESILCQSVKPMELIIVDGGSLDNTVPYIKDYMQGGYDWVKIIIDPSCNSKYTDSPIARGRNVGIKAATQEIIVITDSGTKLPENWLEKITLSLLNGAADCVGGFYEINMGKSIWGKYFSLLYQPLEKDVYRFIPSSRSIAFRKCIWEKIGGYPEGYKYGEDTDFFLRLKKSGSRIIINTEVKSVWYPTNVDSWSGSFKLIYKYARGNGQRLLMEGMQFRSLLFYSILIGIVIFLLLWGWNEIVVLLSIMLLLIWVEVLYLRSRRIFLNKQKNIREPFSLKFLLFLTAFDFTNIYGFGAGLLDNFNNRFKN